MNKQIVSRLMNDKDKALSASILSFSLIFSFVGFTCLSFEVVLNRLYAFIAFRPLVFIEISFAILGIGLGAILFPRVVRRNHKKFPVNILALYGISFPVTFFLILIIPPKDSIIILITSRIVSMIPFILMGILASYFYSERPEKSGILYAFDLCGASLGAIFAVFGIDFLGPIKYTIFLSILMVIISILVAYSQERKINFSVLSCIFATICLAFLLVSPKIQDIPNNLIFNRTVKGKGMFDLSPAEIQKEETRWNSVGRLDLISYNESGEYKNIFIDGATPAIMHNKLYKNLYKKDDDNNKYLNPLVQSVCFVPFCYGSHDKILSIGCGGGLDCLLAKLGKAKEITAVEVNRELVDIVNEQKNFNGDVLNMPGVNAVVNEGRSFIRASKEEYDIILFLLTQGNNAEASGRVMLEDYLMTTEAFEEYYDHLNNGGKIAVATHSFILASRHLMTWIEMLKIKGIGTSEAVRRFVLLRSPEKAYSFLLLFHKEIPTRADLMKIKEFTDETPANPIFIPYLFENTSPIGGMTRGTLSADDYMLTMSHFNISPVTDNKPFHNMVAKGIFLPLKQLLVITSIVLVIMISIPLIFQAPSGLRNRFLVWELFFTCLGIGFMIAEVVLIRRLMLYLGYPALSLAVVLSSMLLSSGIGGLISNKFYSLKKYNIIFIAPILLALLFSFYLFCTTVFMDIFIDKHIVVRCILTFFVISLPGVFLGMAFPAGISISSNQIQNASNWMWGINGIASVLGSILAIILSTLYGMNIAIWAAAAIYAMAGIIGYAILKVYK